MQKNVAKREKTKVCKRKTCLMHAAKCPERSNLGDYLT